MPRVLETERAIGTAISSVIPKGHGIWKGGGFDIRSLSFESFTWRDRDGNCCPSGGKLNAAFDIVSNCMIIKEAIFDFSDLEERALPIVRQSSDSNYLKQPPHLFRGEIIDTVRKYIEWQYLDMHERRFALAPPAMSMDSLVERYVRDNVSGIIYCNAEKAQVLWQMDTIGTIGGHQICRAIYSFRCPKQSDVSGEIIVARVAPSKYRLLYLETMSIARSENEADGIFAFGQDTLLAIKGHASYDKYYSDNYWIWDNEKDVPVSLYQEWVLNETLNHLVPRYLPEGFAARIHKGKWDLRKLTYETYTWRESDSDYKPSGGRLRIQFGIKNHRLFPVDISYSYADTLSE